MVQDGLKGKDEHEAISRIRGAVRYVRNSPARYRKFQDCAEFMEAQKLLSLDVPITWNSTYLMLEAAICLKRAFDAYEDIDLAYKIDISKKPFDGVSFESNWDRP
ncbi:UNVERIFIED_CONTAM: Zinc finger BED domain-containing protein RICESLEEPER 2 [Sesamum radiatum]|uniref:Zinc finger BED domain-containing protein RICESLEEPER 2 n=1 Tax=Sesamum radiatum TaxID=300843 RepID=A0AAW2MXM2_SESRA